METASERGVLPPLPLSNNRCARNNVSSPVTNGHNGIVNGQRSYENRKHSNKKLVTPPASPTMTRRVDMTWYKTIHRRNSKPNILDDDTESTASEDSEGFGAPFTNSGETLKSKFERFEHAAEFDKKKEDERREIQKIKADAARRVRMPMRLLSNEADEEPAEINGTSVDDEDIVPCAELSSIKSKFEMGIEEKQVKKSVEQIKYEGLTNIKGKFEGGSADDSEEKKAAHKQQKLQEEFERLKAERAKMGDLDYVPEVQNEIYEVEQELRAIKETKSILAKFKTMESQQDEVGAEHGVQTNDMRVPEQPLHEVITPVGVDGMFEQDEEALMHAKQTKRDAIAKFKDLECGVNTNNMHGNADIKLLSSDSESETESTQEKEKNRLAELEKMALYAQETKRTALERFKSLESGRGSTDDTCDNCAAPPIRSITPPPDFQGYSEENDEEEAGVKQTELEREKELAEATVFAQKTKRAALERFKNIEAGLETKANNDNFTAPPPLRTITPPFESGYNFDDDYEDNEVEADVNVIESLREKEIEETKALAHESRKAALARFKLLETNAAKTSQRSNSPSKWHVNVPYQQKSNSAFLLDEDNDGVDAASAEIDAVANVDDALIHAKGTRQAALEIFSSIQIQENESKRKNVPPPIRSITPPPDYVTPIHLEAPPERDEIQEEKPKEKELTEISGYAHATKLAALERFRMWESGKHEVQNVGNNREALPPMRCITPPPEGAELHNPISESSDTESGAEDEDMQKTLELARGTKQSALLRFQSLEQGLINNEEPAARMEPPPIRSITPPPDCNAYLADSDSADSDDDRNEKEKELKETLDCARETKQAALQVFQRLQSAEKPKKTAPSFHRITPPPDDNLDSGVEDLHSALELAPEREAIDMDPEDRKIIEQVRETKQIALERFKSLESGVSPGADNSHSASHVGHSEKYIKVPNRSRSTSGESGSISLPSHQDQVERISEVMVVNDQHQHENSVHEMSLEVLEELEQVKQSHTVNSIKDVFQSHQEHNNPNHSEETLRKVLQEIELVALEQPRPVSPPRPKPRRHVSKQDVILSECNNIKESKLAAMERFRILEQKNKPSLDKKLSKSLPAFNSTHWERDVEIISKEH